MRLLRISGLVALLWASSASGQGPIRLRNRVIQPDHITRFAKAPAAGAHYILLFGAFPGPAIRAELARRQIRILGYVPDSALMVSSQGRPNLDGLGVTWSGPLEAADKISPALDAAPPGAYLVIFQPDVDMAVIRAWVQSLGFEILENPYLLPAQLLLTGGSNVAGLADSDLVAYILPASADLIEGNPVMGCAGPLTEAGPLGEYVATSSGWAADAAGNISLQYYFQSLTNQVDPAIVEGEIQRAFCEWQKYAQITLSPADQATAARTIVIQFAHGAHGDAYPFDGPGGVLAHTFYPNPPNSEPIAGDMHFDADESWHVGTNTDIFSVALHEMGHALGLGHSSNPGAVMYPYYRFSSGLTDDDIAGIRALYGTAVSSPSPTPSQPPVQPPTPPSQPPTQPPSQPPVTDTTPPSLTITSPGSTITSTSAATVQIAGKASDNVAVTSVKWTTSNGDSGTASGTTAWSAQVPLLIGSTAVTIRAYDAAGNSAWRSVTIVRH